MSRSDVLLAVKKEPSSIPGAGFHYWLHPFAIGSSREASVWELMGYIIISVTKAEAETLLDNSRRALSHQIKVAHLADAAERAR